LLRAVVGLGDPERGDDGVGARVLELMKAGPDTFRLQPSQDMLSLVDLGKACPHVILVDAARSGGEPGTVLTLELVGPMSKLLKRGGTNPLGPFMHGVDLSQVLLMADGLGQLPEKLMLYGVVGASFARGAPLSPAVEAAAHELALLLSLEL